MCAFHRRLDFQPCCYSGLLLDSLRFLIDRSKLFREDGSSFNNIVSIHIDASHPHSFGIFAVQNISACAIDAQLAPIGRETFAVLRQIPCCVETIVYHDYCDSDAKSFSSVAGALEILSPGFAMVRNALSQVTLTFSTRYSISFLLES